MAYIPLPQHMEEGLVALIKSMYAQYDPKMISFSCASKSPYGGRGSFYSGATQSTFVWSYDKRPYIVTGPGD